MATDLTQYVIDDSLNGRRLNEDIHAVVHDYSVLVGWTLDDQDTPVFISVHSSLHQERFDEKEAVEIAADYLREIGVLPDPIPHPGYILTKEGEAND